MDLFNAVLKDVTESEQFEVSIDDKVDVYDSEGNLVESFKTRSDAEKKYLIF